MRLQQCQNDDIGRKCGKDGTVTGDFGGGMATHASMTDFYITTMMRWQ